ncbi:MAG: TIM barrel protein [Cyclobacteriaceae bacterium]
MKRRTFIKLSGAIGAASCLPFACAPSTSSPKFKLGYQLYSIRDEMEKDPMATLKVLKEMGYEDFEHYGFNADEGTYYGYKASDFKSRLDDLGLSVSSGHYPFSGFWQKPEDELKAFVDRCIEGARVLNSHYITWPWMDEEQRTEDGFKQTAERLNMVGKMVREAGLGFAYHNHGYDFLEFDGVTGYEIIANNTDPELVKLQLDMYWVMHSSKMTPAQWIEKYPGRHVMWHIKDMHKVSRDYTELGNGSIDYTKLLPDPTLSGLEYYYIEQGGNYTENSTKSAAASAKYFKNHLQRYL